MRAKAVLAAAIGLLLIAAVVAGCSPGTLTRAAVRDEPGALLDEVPEYFGEPSVVMRDGVPGFSQEDLERGPFEEYSPLDDLGRCGAAFALVGPETMPDESRGSIGMVRPSGWQISKYAWVDGGYLYNRCHLVAFQLTGENDNERNLITGTRYLNVQGMQPYESEVAEYVRATGNHVLYRVTPVFAGENLVASGVLMEAQSVEDDGVGVRFCAWCYNVEPGVEIDYSTGANRADGTVSADSASAGGFDGQVAGSPAAELPAAPVGASEPGDAPSAEQPAYILNTNTHRFHLPTCPSVDEMKEKNKQPFYGTREEAIAADYRPCGVCNP